MMKLIEENSGAGELTRSGENSRSVRYRIRRYQGMMEGSGLPIPGLHRIEGSIDFGSSPAPDGWMGAPLTLKLEDGRTLGITVTGPDGRVLSEGHGPGQCGCC